MFSQPNWGSDWKFFRADYVFDKEMYEKEKLNSNFVSAVTWAEDGTIWFASGNEINVYDKGKINKINNKAYGKPGAVTDLKFDSKGILWVGTTSGLYTMNKDGAFQYIQVPEIRVVTEVAIDKNDKIYVSGFSSDAINASPGGLSVYNGSEWKNYSKKNGDFPKKFIEDITFDNNGNVWASNGVEDNGLVMFNGTEWTFYNKENSGLESNTVRAIAFDSKNNGWFGTPKGLVKFDGETWTVYTLKDLIYGTMFSNLTKYLDEPDLLSVAIDKNDVVWIGTEGQGVIRVEGGGRTVMNEENSPITSNYVREIIIDDQNRKWFLTGYVAENWSDRFTKDLDASKGSIKGVVMYQDPDYNQFPDWEVHNNFTSDIPGNSFYEIERDADGTMWLASAEYGLVEYKDGGWKVYQDPERGMVGEMLNCIAIGAGDEKYAGAQMKGLFQVSGDQLAPRSQEEFGHDKKSLIDIELDNEGNVWIGHIAGVDMCSGGNCEHFNKKNGMTSSNVFSIKKDSKGRMWICHTKGISVYDHGSWVSYDKKLNGLKGYVYDVVEDANGTMWAGSGKGLYKLEGDQWTLIEPMGSGVPSYLSVQCMTIDNDGTLWMGSTANAVYTMDKEGIWNYYNWENSGVLFGKIYDIEIAQNGDVWISLDKGGTVAKTSSYTSGGTMPTGPDPGYEIKQKIENFDPSAALVIYKKGK